MTRNEQHLNQRTQHHTNSNRRSYGTNGKQADRAAHRRVRCWAGNIANTNASTASLQTANEQTVGCATTAKMEKGKPCKQLSCDGFSVSCLISCKITTGMARSKQTTVNDYSIKYNQSRSKEVTDQKKNTTNLAKDFIAQNRLCVATRQHFMACVCM